MHPRPLRPPVEVGERVRLVVRLVEHVGRWFAVSPRPDQEGPKGYSGREKDPERVAALRGGQLGGRRGRDHALRRGTACNGRWRVTAWRTTDVPDDGVQQGQKGDVAD